MPSGLVAIILFSIVAGVGGFIAITKIIVNHLESRRGAAGGSSLTESELGALVAAAVADAIEPLSDELNGLRKQLAAREEQGLLPEHRQSDDKSD